MLNNVLVGLKNPFRFFATLLHIIKNHIAIKFPHHSFIIKGEPTLLEIEKGKDYEVNTKRFSFYKRLLAEFVYSGSYSFEEIKEKSILLLLNSSATAENLEQIESFLESYGLNL